MTIMLNAMLKSLQLRATMEMIVRERLSYLVQILAAPDFASSAFHKWRARSFALRVANLLVRNDKAARARDYAWRFAVRLSDERASPGAEANSKSIGSQSLQPRSRRLQR